MSESRMWRRDVGEQALLQAVLLQAFEDLKHLASCGVICIQQGELALNTNWPGFKQSRRQSYSYRPKGIERHHEVQELCEFWEQGDAQRFLTALGYQISARQILSRISFANKP